MAYRIRLAISVTYRRVASDTPGSPRSARDTVAADTPAARATSDMLVNSHLPAWYEISENRTVGLPRAPCET
ncbi:hypothetical protein GCM10027184_54460 [Saccharothrix stipae]